MTVPAPAPQRTPGTDPVAPGPAAAPGESILAGRPAALRASSPEAPPTDAVRRYYEASTARFLRLGGSGAAAAIHRPLWADCVTTPAGAADHINARIADLAGLLLPGPPDRVLDMGCGVGGTLLHLARRWPDAALEGLTLSAEQVRIARALAARRGLAGRVQVRQADFLHPAAARQPADLVLAIESHVHAPSAAAFLAAAARALRPGGLLVVVDDMLARPEATLSPAEAARLDAFRRGWHLGHVPDVAGFVSTAGEAGLVPAMQQDLTLLLRLTRARDRALRVAGPVADALGLGRWPLFANMIGGNALTESYRNGTMRYTLAAFRRRGGGAA